MTGQGDRWRPVVLVVPFLFALLPILTVVRANPGQVPWQAASDLAALALLAALAVLALAHAATRDGSRAALLAAVAVLGTTAYGVARDTFVLRSPLGVADQTFLLAWLAAVAVVALLALRLRPRTAGDAGKVLALVAVLLVAFAVPGVVGSLRAVPEPVSRWDDERPAWAERREPATLPDVYFILLDGHGSSWSHQELLGYDDAAFLGALEASGFYLANRSHTNYPFTLLQMPTVLNMDYTQELAPRLGLDPLEEADLTSLIRDNRVEATFNALGYTTVAIETNWPPTQGHPHTDLDLRCQRGLTDVEALVLRSTVFRGQADAVTSRTYYDMANCQFEALEVVAGLGAPTFTYAHILSPHAPYVFAADGGFRDSGILPWEPVAHPPEEFRAAYVEQVTYVDQRILAAVEHILAVSDSEPLILLVSDHGHGLLTYEHRWSHEPPAPGEQFWDPANATRQQILQEAGRNFEALLLPCVPANQLYADISPVNLFRLVFQACFGADLPLVADRLFLPNAYDPHGAHIVPFDQDLTAQVQYPGDPGSAPRTASE